MRTNPSCTDPSVHQTQEMAAPQPNYPAIGAHLQGLADEAVLVPNAEPITFLQMKALFDQFENQIMARSVVSFWIRPWF